MLVQSTPNLQSMRFLTCLFLVLFSLMNLHAQEISNGDFEEWILDDDSNLVAVGWEVFGNQIEDSTGNLSAHCLNYSGGAWTIWLQKNEIVEEVPDGIKFKAWHYTDDPFSFFIPCPSNGGAQYNCDLFLVVEVFHDGDIIESAQIDWYDSYSCGGSVRCFEVPFSGVECDSLKFSLVSSLWNHQSSMAFDDFEFYESVGIEENNQVDFSVAPNPVSDLLSIQSLDDEIWDEIQISDMLGLRVFNTGFRNDIDLSNLQNGIYILTVLSKGVPIYNQRVIKR